MHSCALMFVEKLDRIFNGYDVADLLLINTIEQCGQGRRLARSPGASHQHDPFAQIGDFFEANGKIQRREARNGCRDHTHDDGATAALNENVDAKTSYTREPIRD